MRCKNFKNCLERYSENALPRRKQARCSAHLEKCLKCRSLLVEIDELKSLFTEIPIPPEPGNLTDTIMRSIRNSTNDARNRDKRILMEWWKNASIPVQIACIALLFIIATAGVFAGRDLWGTPAPKTYAGFTELDTFTESQKGSLEDIYLRLIETPVRGSER